jgi:predicted dehydrogenase
MNQGIHVFLEKPACITETACEKLLEAKEKSSVQVMVGQVLRSFEEYRFLKKAYDEQTFGKLKSIVMQRLSGTANWGFENWFHDESRSGSAVLDLHIHDLDFLRYLLGEPDGLQVKATAFPSGVVNHIVTQYQFKEVFASAEGIWDISPAIPFEAGFRAHFEQGTVVFRSNQEHTLQVYLPDGTSYVPTIHKEFEKIDHSAGINISELGPYYTEIKYFIDCLQSGEVPVIATLEDGIQSVRLALEELRLAKEYISKNNTNNS